MLSEENGYRTCFEERHILRTESIRKLMRHLDPAALSLPPKGKSTAIIRPAKSGGVEKPNPQYIAFIHMSQHAQSVLVMANALFNGIRNIIT